MHIFLFQLLPIFTQIFHDYFHKFFHNYFYILGLLSISHNFYNITNLFLLFFQKSRIKAIYSITGSVLLRTYTALLKKFYFHLQKLSNSALLCIQKSIHKLLFAVCLITPYFLTPRKFIITVCQTFD